ncbi:voltage-gated potassium channel [Macrolepiota fuliginosa MF-IS2]|uniref:Voltage-gated potassium channel n=1 Tax=Macrolepiota fuliginosa MF-IS2 TaxID=1400762 RepID=A0A9P5X7A2_9AGAR|nr:voltage-gated potassium channel [Macrolepiota fuliginosa MF-IS2]
MKQGKHGGLSMTRHTSHHREEGPFGVEGEEELAYYQPTLWWFTSVVFPLIAGTFGPIANLFSVCGLAQPWRQIKATGAHITDPGWILALNTTSLVLALVANLLLLFNFAKRISYKLAQPFTIIFWYTSSSLLVIPIALTHTIFLHPDHILSQSYHYAFISTIIYFIISTLLLFNLIGTYTFHAYPASFAQLTMAQRTLMLQTIIFSLYLALGAGVFSAIEDWSFNDALYWADYTLLTIGLGSDFPLMKTAGRMLLFPFAAIGIIFVGLVVSSVQGLVLERGKVRITKRHLETERRRWEAIIDGQSATITRERELRKFGKAREKCLAKVTKLREEEEEEDTVWRRREFELMRYIEMNAARMQKYIALAFSVGVFVLVWVGGSVVFWALENNGADWTYPESLFFSYTSILTIGYGDFFPTTNASRPFFVIWSLVAIPAVTVLISNMGQTVVKGVDEATVWLGQRSILPERVGSKRHEDGKKEDEGKESEGMRERVGQELGKENGGGEGVEEGVKTEAVEEVKEGVSTSATVKVRDGVEIATGDATEGQSTTEAPLAMLMARLAHEISHIARDVSERSNMRYAWHEWVRWLKLMDEASERLDVISGWSVNFRMRSLSRVTVGGEGEEEGTESGGRGVEVWRWTWLDDHGPLFSARTEAQWVLDRLCLLLERVAEQCVEEVREGGGR